MIAKCHRVILGLLIAFAGVPASAAGTEADPLFSDDSILDVRIVAPFKQIMREKPTDDDDDNDNDPEGTLSLIIDEDTVLDFPVRIVTRGNNRRDVCKFVPLRVDFDKDELEGTMFDGQNKLKMVTHCWSRDRAYRQSVIREYLAYRVLNILTDISFRVRLMRMTYVYSDDKNKEEQNYAFFIESKKRLGERIGKPEQKDEFTSIVLLDPAYTNLTSVFEYFIGNLDFSPVMGAAGETCCHNYSLFSSDRETFWSIPYDFDLTGFVEAKHAQFDPKGPRKTLRHRVYYGWCRNEEFVPQSLQAFRDKRGEIEALIASHPELSDGRRKRLQKYIENFYEELEDEDKLLRKFADDCRG
jgi:hypothetical protein